MLNGHLQLDTNDIDELDGLLSMNDLGEFDMGKYTMKLLSGVDRLYQLKTCRAAHLMNTMAMYRKQGLFCDVTLCVKGQRHLAHKVILAAASPYFSSMFGQSGHIEAHTTRDIDLSETVSCPNAMNIILDFLYTSQVQLNDKSVSFIFNRKTKIVFNISKNSVVLQLGTRGFNVFYAIIT
jgi:hypothetical protein